MNTTRTARLAAFAAGLRYEDIPQPVIRKAEDLLVDWFGSAIAGKGARPVETITVFAASMGPAMRAGEGASELLVGRTFTSPYFAAMANAGPRRKHRSSSTRAAVTRIPPRTHCCR